MLINLANTISSKINIDGVLQLLHKSKVLSYNSIFCCNKLSNFDFIINGNRCDKKGTFVVDTNTADINFFNSKVIHNELDEIINKQRPINIEYDKLFSFPLDLLYEGECNIGIKIFKPGCRIYPHNHNIGDDSPVIMGLLLNDLSTPAEFYTGDTTYIPDNVESLAGNITQYLQNRGDLFIFKGEFVHSFFTKDYAEILLISFNRNALVYNGKN